LRRFIYPNFAPLHAPITCHSPVLCWV
jgi:hypothetical protein